MTKITINLQGDLYLRLKQFIPSGQISKFIAESIEEKLEDKEMALFKAYKEAYSDADRNKAINEWDVLNVDVDEEVSSNEKRSLNYEK